MTVRHSPFAPRLAMRPGTAINLYAPVTGTPPVVPDPPPVTPTGLMWTGGPWNTLIDWTTAVVGGAGRTFAQWTGGLGYAYLNVSRTTDAPTDIWHTNNADPLWTCSGMFNGTFAGQTVQLHIPNGFAVPDAGGDQNANIWNSDTGYHYDFYGTTNINAGAHTLNVQAIWQLHQNQDGWGLGTWPNGTRRGSRAAGCQFGGGEITNNDLRAGKIAHALGLAANNSNWSKTPVRPAMSQDGYWQNANSYTGTVPMGTMFAIPPSSRGGPTKPTGLSTIGSMVWDAVRDYGTYAVDSTGSFTWYCDAGDDAVSASAVDPLRFNQQDGNKVLNAMRMITKGKPTLDHA